MAQQYLGKICFVILILCYKNLILQYFIFRALLEINDYCNILKVKINGYVSNPNFSAKKQIFILFINNRLVDSQGKF